MTIETMAEDHAEFYALLSKRVYKDAFIHGFKHGVESTTEKNSTHNIIKEWS